MSRTKSFFVAAAVGCLSLARVAFADAPVSDSQITDRVLGKLSVDDPSVVKHVQVETKDGIVTLTGYAHTGPEAAKALHDAGTVAGVVKVQNRIALAQ
jgi:osmotically-inducible protein OsmY